MGHRGKSAGYRGILWDTVDAVKPYTPWDIVVSMWDTVGYPGIPWEVAQNTYGYSGISWNTVGIRWDTVGGRWDTVRSTLREVAEIHTVGYRGKSVGNRGIPRNVGGVP